MAYDTAASNSPESRDITTTSWLLRVATLSHTEPQERLVKLSTQKPFKLASHNLQPGTHLIARHQHWRQRQLSRKKSAFRDLLPILELYREIANLMESKIHTSLEILAVEASQLIHRDGGFQDFSLRFLGNDTAIEDSPQGNTSYRFSNPWYQSYRNVQTEARHDAAYSKSFIALGSNVGPRISMIEQACTEMARRGLAIRRTSALYETQPMYMIDQHPFINGACEIETKLSPLELLDELKDIEDTLGRVKTVRNGPRAIDLDILLYNDDVVDEERLQIPHPRISERDFVLRPLCDMIPHSFLPQPSILCDFSDQLSLLPFVSTPISTNTPLARFHSTSPVPRSCPVLTSTLTTRKTQLMAILNLTPDSFSNDGKHTPTFSPSSLLPQLNSLLHHQVPILDIGGQSTRPHASPLSAEEELDRILPTIRYIRSNSTFNNIILSIDTYHSSVARVSIEAGADIINDVSGGLMDSKMFPTIAELECTYVLMHMRGTPETMNTLTTYPDGVINGVATELNERVQKAMEAGIRRWRIILDPGIGFAKTGSQNLEVMRKLPELREWEGLKGMPWCVGVSRKRFIGRITGVPGDSGREADMQEVKEGNGPSYIDAGDGKAEKANKGWEASGPRILNNIPFRTPETRKPEIEPRRLNVRSGPSYVDTNDEVNKAERSIKGWEASGPQTLNATLLRPPGAEKRMSELTSVKPGSGPSYINLDLGPDSNSKRSGTFGPSDLQSDPETSTTTTVDGTIQPSYIDLNDDTITTPSSAIPATPLNEQSPKPTQINPSSSTSQTKHPTTPPPQPTQTTTKPPDEEMQQRIWGTAAAVTACIQGGADIVRVHDWEEMSKVVRMGDAVWRV
ncbi:MAG: hypothetical protein Q9169_005813 [Polycauliona sp. 2 TL-2023]